MAAPVLRPLSTGEVLDTGFGLYRSLFFPLIIVAIACRTIPLILGIYLQQVSGTAPMAIFDHWKFLIGHFVLAMLLNVIAVAATTSLVAGAYLGEPITANEALRRAFRVIGPLTLVWLVSSIAIGLGIVVLIVPGLILWSGLVLASAVVVLEPHAGAMGALNRSWALTSGSRFKVFISIFVAALFFLIPAMIVNVFGAIASMAHARSPLATGVLTGILQIFVAPFIYVVITVLYYDLRVRKEGFDLEILATATQSAS